RLMLLQNADDLFFRKPGSLHCLSPSSRHSLTQNREHLRGARQNLEIHVVSRFPVGIQNEKFGDYIKTLRNTEQWETAIPSWEKLREDWYNSAFLPLRLNGSRKFAFSPPRALGSVDTNGLRYSADGKAYAEVGETR